MEKRKANRGRRRTKAATEDIVGQRPAPARIPSKWRKYYNRLMDLRNQMADRQVNLSKAALEEAPSFSTHLADAGTDTYERDLALGLLSSEQDAVYEIDEAIDRLRHGNYGKCELTGKPIEPARLEAIPWTRFSAQAERELEKEGAVPHARLGPRESVPRTQAAKAQEETE